MERETITVEEGMQVVGTIINLLMKKAIQKSNALSDYYENLPDDVLVVEIKTLDKIIKELLEEK